ncbi:Hypothetical predicted protein, partial [Mytilus galloprovincialis]
MYRKTGRMYRIQLDGTVVYQYQVSGESGVTVDAQGNVYVNDGDINEIRRLQRDEQFRDVVLTRKD